VTARTEAEIKAEALREAAASAVRRLHSCTSMTGVAAACVEGDCEHPECHNGGESPTREFKVCKHCADLAEQSGLLEDSWPAWIMWPCATAVAVGFADQATLAARLATDTAAHPAQPDAALTDDERLVTELFASKVFEWLATFGVEDASARARQVAKSFVREGWSLAARAAQPATATLTEAERTALGADLTKWFHDTTMACAHRGDAHECALRAHNLLTFGPLAARQPATVDAETLSAEQRKSVAHLLRRVASRHNRRAETRDACLAVAAALSGQRAAVVPAPEGETDPCICPPDYCLGAESDTGSTIECAACLALDPEAACLHDLPAPEVATDTAAPEGEGRYRLSKARTHGAARLLAARRDRVRDLAGRAQAEGQVEFAASLRGKARAYNEAVWVVEALENDRPLPSKVRDAAPEHDEWCPANGCRDGKCPCAGPPLGPAPAAPVAVEETWSQIAESDGWLGVSNADLHGRAVEGVAWGLIEATMDTSDREPAADVWRDALATAQRILPAAPAAVEGVETVEWMVRLAADDSLVLDGSLREGYELHLNREDSLPLRRGEKFRRTRFHIPDRVSEWSPVEPETSEPEGGESRG
jgi:hypothetical protein